LPVRNPRNNTCLSPLWCTWRSAFQRGQAAHFCYHSLESGLPLTIVEAIYVGVNSKYPVATTAIYPLWMQFVVSCNGFMDGAIADTSVFLRQSAPS
jgi:hypothetical protein